MCKCHVTYNLWHLRSSNFRRQSNLWPHNISFPCGAARQKLRRRPRTDPSRSGSEARSSEGMIVVRDPRKELPTMYVSKETQSSVRTEFCQVHRPSCDFVFTIYASSQARSLEPPPMAVLIHNLSPLAPTQHIWRQFGRHRLFESFELHMIDKDTGSAVTVGNSKLKRLRIRKSSITAHSVMGRSKNG